MYYLSFLLCMNAHNEETEYIQQGTHNLKMKCSRRLVKKHLIKLRENTSGIKSSLKKIYIYIRYLETDFQLYA